MSGRSCLQLATNVMMRNLSWVTTIATEHPTEKPTPVTIHVVSSKASVRVFTGVLPATAGKGDTSCNTNGDYTNGTATYTLGQPARTITNEIQQEHIRIIMPHGAHITLWCQVAWRSWPRFSLEPTRQS
jgi:hypothetical protein